MAIELNPEAQQRLERYNHALLEEDGTVEHELATYMDAFLEGYNDKPHPPYHGIGSEEDITDILEQNDTFDTLEDALYDYCEAHKDMSKKDYASLVKAADSMPVPSLLRQVLRISRQRSPHLRAH